MRWLRNISFSPSPSGRSSTPTSGGDSPTRRASSDYHHDRGSASRFGSSKYARHRKLRDLSGYGGSSAKWTDSAPEPVAASRSHDSSDRAVPLPLPEFDSIFQRREGFLHSNSGSGEGDCRLPSPKTRHGRGVEEHDGDRDRTTPVSTFGRRDLANVSMKSVFESGERQRKEDHAETKSSRAMHEELKRYEPPRRSFWIDIPSRSAPTSPLASRVVSPQRNSSTNLSHYYHVVHVGNGNQVWSAPELPSSARLSGVYPTFFDAALSAENSPLHSPSVRSPHPRSPTGASSSLHTMQSLEPHTLRRESSCPVSVHPLPLPPGPSIPSLSVPITQANTKAESLSMKDQWQKGKLIGRGTFGSVYVASNVENGALCAMKEVELFPDDPKSAECIKQLEQEIKVLSQLKHPNIVQYYGSDIVEDRLYIYLEYVHPGSINKYVREHFGAITESVVRNFTRHILSGLAYLHSTKTIHRDIKGANLLVDSSGVVKLADFGMAKHLTGQAADLSLKGSPYWMAPELLLSVMQKDNSPELALAVDIWSLGCTIIEMFTGKPPWSEFEGAAAMFKVMRDSPTIPESLSFEARDFLKCCFLRNPAERYTAAMLLEHPFMKNLQQPDASSCSQAYAGVNLLDRCYSPREAYSSKHDQQFPILPNLQNSKRKLAAESVIGHPSSHHENFDITVTSRYSPRSTLEALPISSSPTHAVHNAHNLSPSAHGFGGVNLTNKKNYTLR